MLRLARAEKSEYAMAEMMAEAADRIADGSALEKLRMLVRVQGGDVNYIDNLALFPKASIVETLTASSDGYVAQLSALNVGLASVDLGAGRSRKEDPVDHAVGIIVHKKVGDTLTKGEATFTIHANDPHRLAQAKEYLKDAIVSSPHAVAPLPMFYNTIEGSPTVK
jgi:pyrimidine-nucleoside phosphorylase